MKLTNNKADPLYWKTDVWYTHVVRCWPAGEDTQYAFFVRDGSTGIWRHLSTVGVKEKNIQLQGGNDAFIEDWGNNGDNTRKVHLRNNWRRKNDGEWLASQNAKFSVNSWDLKEGGRSFLHQDKWNAGVSRDNTGEFYHMEIGGLAKTQKPLAYPEKTTVKLSLKNAAEKPGYTEGKLNSIELQQDQGKLTVSWTIEEKALPQFAYSLELLDSESKVLSKVTKQGPHIKNHVFDMSALDKGKRYSVALSVSDIFDNETKREVKGFTPKGN